MSSKQVPASKQIIFPYELFQNAIPWWEREGWIHKAACMEGPRFPTMPCLRQEKGEECPGFSLPLALQSPVSVSLWPNLAGSQTARNPQKCNFQEND